MIADLYHKEEARDDRNVKVTNQKGVGGATVITLGVPSQYTLTSWVSLEEVRGRSQRVHVVASRWRCILCEGNRVRFIVL
ncbi:hypothetical protein PoB_001747000 [Plakobranchus ocellatus]|uniref:Uncharacterized protein n=1 Tax=Plakobranchus ocellatus TaxID=259542 RepID=A0AAV3Z665_9GAST|nr:hypothetical protein PoB_001747000 [Plakobranchus ocellatus]